VQRAIFLIVSFLLENASSTVLEATPCSVPVAFLPEPDPNNKSKRAPSLDTESSRRSVLSAKFPETSSKIWSGLVQIRLSFGAFLRAMSQHDDDLAGVHSEEGDRHGVVMDDSDYEDDELDQSVSVPDRCSVLCS
jgi:hypothetical protein